MARARTQPPKDTFWKKAAYVTANGTNAVALYRVLTGAMGLILLAMLGTYGSRTLSFEDNARRDTATMGADIMALRERATALETALDMANKRTDRIVDRVNGDAKDIAAMQARIEFLMMPRR